MERENRPSELTGQGENTYSNSGSNNMANLPNAESTPQPNNREQQIVDQITNRMQQQGLEVDADSMQTIRGIAKLAQAGVFEMPGFEGPNRPRGQRKERGPRAPLGASDASQVNEGSVSPDAQAQEALTETLSRGEAEQLAQVKEAVGWLVDSDKREQYFNDIYALVDARPHEFFDRAFDPLSDGVKEKEFMEAILNSSRGRWEEVKIGRYNTFRLPQEEIRKAAEVQGKTLDQLQAELAADFYRYQQERQVRKVLHDVNAILYLPSVKAEDLFNSMQQFQSGHGDIAFKMPGVREMMNLYEETLYECMSENDGYLDPEAVLGKVGTSTRETAEGSRVVKYVRPGEIEERAKERFKRMLDRQQIVTRTDDGKESVLTKLEPWEIDRTFTVARGMMVMTQRLLEIASESKLPEGGTQFASAFLQDIVQSYSVHRHLLSKWGITEEALSAYMAPKEKAQFLKGWVPKQIIDNWEKLQKNPDMLHDLDNSFYLGKVNANRAGGFWTWNSWRAIEDSTKRSALRNFLVEGEKRMRARGGNVDEYKNWTGTGFRFEKMRPKIEEAIDEENHHMSHGEKDKTIGNAKQLIEKMTEFQGHRLYLTSRHIRMRVLKQIGVSDPAHLSIEQKTDLKDRLDSLHEAEVVFLKNREAFLNSGRTFNSITINDLVQYLDQVITDDMRDSEGKVLVSRGQRIENARQLAWAVKNDFTQNQELYWKEFITNREYTHGFVLWTGDVPVDEYNMAELGPTGALARRARDNGHQVKAAEAEVGMLDNLKNISHPDQLMASLFGIWQNIDHYDRGKARKVIAEKAEGLIKFYKATWKTNIPVLGVMARGGDQTSAARMLYGPHAAAWESSDIVYLIDRMAHAKMINHEDEKRLKKLTGATAKNVLGEGIINLSQFLGFMYMFITGETILKEAPKLEDIG